MPNNIFRSRATNLIRHAIAEAESARSLDHTGLTGTCREIVLDVLLRPFIPPDYVISSGKITDSRGTLSLQTDLIIHNPRLLPPILYKHDGREGTFPCEACFYAIEVKSTLTAGEVQ